MRSPRYISPPSRTILRVIPKGSRIPIRPRKTILAYKEGVNCRVLKRPKSRLLTFPTPDPCRCKWWRMRGSIAGVWRIIQEICRWFGYGILFSDRMYRHLFPLLSRECAEELGHVGEIRAVHSRIKILMIIILLSYLSFNYTPVSTVSLALV